MTAQLEAKGRFQPFKAFPTKDKRFKQERWFDINEQVSYDTGHVDVTWICDSNSLGAYAE